MLANHFASLPACSQTASTMPEDAQVALEKLKAENEAMEKEIMNLTKGSLGGDETKQMTTKKSGGGIKVLSYGAPSGGGAGIDNGSAWCPPSCARRTVLGGFFTS